MILSMLRVYWLNLRRDPLALVLTFVVPIAFFSVFAAVFGSMDARQPVRVAIVVADRSESAEKLVAELRAFESLELIELDAAHGREGLAERLRAGHVSVGVVVPDGFGASLRQESGPRPSIDILADTSNPVALEMVRGALRAAAYPLTAPPLRDYGDPDGKPVSEEEPLGIEVVDVLGHEGKLPSVAFFAAGIGVMFLLFAVSGRSAILIDERESGVLVRMLTSRLTLTQLLLARSLYLWTLGYLQVTTMFTWGALVFGLELFTRQHLLGFLVMTAATAAAAAAFALFLGVLCKTRAQLNGLAIVLVLMMSAIGGSMFPRFLMPESLQAIGRFSFNAWALDGYRKVFWYEAGISELGAELLVLGATTLLLLAGAGLMARRWRYA